MTLPSGFKTVEGEAEYLQVYEGTLRELWPVPYEELSVASRFGTTHVVASGPSDAPPLVLLHGFMNTLVIWAPYIADFSKDYRVFAIDTMGQPSKSAPKEPIREAAGFVEWLGVTLDGLDLFRVSIASISFGAWIALNFAMAEPDRVAKLALLSPAASLQPLAKQFGLRAILSALVPTRWMMNSFMSWMGLEDSPSDPLTGAVLDLMWLGVKHFRMPPESRRVMPTSFSDDELRSLQVPVMLLIGEDEVIFNPAKALARARHLISEFDGELIPDCRHDMSISQHHIVQPLLLGFLGDN